jgi:hypothetical protein
MINGLSFNHYHKEIRSMITKLIDGIGAAIGSKYLKNKNQFVFVEYGTGAISTLDLVRPVLGTASSGTILLKGTWSFNCDIGSMTAGPFDIFWEQMDAVNRQMAPQGNAKIVNLGVVNFTALNPAAMQLLNYDTTPINGNNNATNKLVNGDVFCVKTNGGNFTKIKVVTYGYNIKIQWVTYHLASGYTKIGVGYNTPEDIAVLADEQTAYVTERTGNFSRVDLTNANRAASALVSSGLNAPQQMWIDELHQQGYVVEYANPGRLVRIDLGSGVQTVLYASLNLAVGLVVSSDLAFAYVTEQGSGVVSKISLSSGTRSVVASGLPAPFFLTWADDSESSLLVTERDPANSIAMINLSQAINNVTVLSSAMPFRNR